MTKVVITGHKSNIAKEFKQLLDKSCEVYEVHTDDMKHHVDGNVYLMCHGVLYSKPSSEQTVEEISNSMKSNFLSYMESINLIFDRNPDARICVIGSHSGYVGSYDDSYARNKRYLHSFVESKKTTGNQQLVGIAPSIIENAGMTTRRKDRDNLDQRRRKHPMGRFIQSLEVARLAHVLLFEQPYINRTVIRMHGGDI